MKMRLAVFGNEVTVLRLTVSLAGRGVELVRLSEAREAKTRLRREKFDLAVVDNLAEEAETICRYIGKLKRVPLVLMVGKKRVDWEKLSSLGIAGYITQAANGAELVARLQAVSRRCLFNGEIEKNGNAYHAK